MNETFDIDFGEYYCILCGKKITTEDNTPVIKKGVRHCMACHQKVYQEVLLKKFPFFVI